MAPFADLLASARSWSASPPRSRSDHDPAALARYGRLEEEVRQHGGYALEARVKELARATSASRSATSRGRSARSRAASATSSSSPWCCSPRRTCCCSTSRPTTSTPSACERLEEFLRDYPGAFVLVSHDRTLLDAVAKQHRRARRRRARRLPRRLGELRRRARPAPSRPRCAPTSGSRRRSRAPRTSSAATSPGRRPTRPSRAARCSRSSSA